MNTDLLEQAHEFAKLAHFGQKRYSGEDYIIHPEAVVEILREWNTDLTTQIAGMLHDTVEDGGATREDIVMGFGEDVAKLVDGVTKVSSLKLQGSQEEKFVENLRKMLLAMASDLRVVLVKLADRLHNMRTLEYVPVEKQTRIARETLEIYAPLAERMGMGKVKTELEDIAFKYVYPDKYQELVKIAAKFYKEKEAYLGKFEKELKILLLNKKIKFSLNLRHKGLYSLFKKLKRPEISGELEKIYDLVASRIMVDSVEDCYLVLGLIHGKWRPVPYLGITDYIASPKPNGYRSIHTKIFGPEGKIVEVQIRTFEMHEQAEMGVSAHWHYSEVKSKGISEEVLEKGTKVKNEKLDWVKQLVSWQKEISDSAEYLQALKFDAFAQRNFVFSPKGDVFDLPNGATPIDFAYAVHTKLGHQAVGAKVNGKMVSLDFKLHNGDVVEILIDRKRGKPNPDWAKFVVTTAAKHQISKEGKT